MKLLDQIGQVFSRILSRKIKWNEEIASQFNILKLHDFSGEVSLCSGSERISRGRPSEKKSKQTSPKTAHNFDNEMHLLVKEKKKMYLL